MALVNSEFRIYSPSASLARYILNQYFSTVQAETRSCSFGTDWRRLCTCTTPETTDWKANAWKVMGGLLLDFHVSFCTVFLDLIPRPYELSSKYVRRVHTRNPTRTNVASGAPGGRFGMGWVNVAPVCSARYELPLLSLINCGTVSEPFYSDGLRIGITGLSF